MKPFVLAALAALLGLGPALAGDLEAGAIHIGEPWARPSLGQNPNSAAYLVLDNRGEAADRLVKAESPVAERVEIHTVLKEGAVMRMRPVKEGVALPAGANVALEPGGLHVMLMGLSRRLAPGESFPLTLIFEKAGAVEVSVRVGSVGGKPAGMDAGAGADGHGHGHHDETHPEPAPNPAPGGAHHH